MNRYNYTNIQELSILERMALLREQRNLVKTLHCIHEDDSIVKKEPKKQVHAFLGLSTDAEALAHLRNHPILLTDKVGQFAKSIEDKGYFGRASKIATLLQSCIDSGFLIPVENPVKEDSDKYSYFRISDRGTDLLHFFGFLQIAVEKYSGVRLFLIGVLTGVIVPAVLFFYNHFN